MKNQSEFECECEFCGSQFKHNSSLKNHLNNAKFCLDKRNNVEKDTKFICEFCNTEFKSKRNLKSHITICREKDIYYAKAKLKEEHLEELRLF